jgi:hypothetical protein
MFRGRWQGWAGPKEEACIFLGPEVLDLRYVDARVTDGSIMHMAISPEPERLPLKTGVAGSEQGVLGSGRSVVGSAEDFVVQGNPFDPVRCTLWWSDECVESLQRTEIVTL